MNTVTWLIIDVIYILAKKINVELKYLHKCRKQGEHYIRISEINAYCICKKYKEMFILLNSVSIISMVSFQNISD